MRQAQRKKEKDKVAIALMLAFCVIALTSIFTIKSNIDKINGSNTDVPVSEKTQTDAPGKAEKTPAASGDDKTVPAEETSSKVPTVDSAGNSGGEASASKFINPVKSDEAYVTNEYSMVVSYRSAPLWARYKNYAKLTAVARCDCSSSSSIRYILHVFDRG